MSDDESARAIGVYRAALQRYTFGVQCEQSVGISRR